MHRIKFLFLFLTPFFVFAQNGKLTGIVYGAGTKNPLAFVSVAIKETGAGTITDIDGRFSFAQVPDKITLVISYIGYKTKELPVNNNNTPLHIEISQNDNQLETVVVGSGENPAHRIIKLMLSNKKNNDPAFKNSFKYNAYTVAALGAGNSLFTTAKKDTALTKKKSSISKENAKDKKNDSAAAAVLQKFKDNYLMVTESYTERIFRFPDRSKETVLASKISGLKAAPFAVTPDNFQPFGFYNDYLLMLNTSYVSPVIKGSIAMYRFRINETLIHENDTTFIISFEPRKGKNFNGLKGLLYINSNGYAIENVIASAAEKKGTAFRFRLQQKYERVQGQWFPQQLNTTISQVSLQSDSVLAYWDTRSYITNISIGGVFPRSAFSDITQEFDLAAGKKTDKEWEQFRLDTLRQKEKMTYKNYDSLPIKILNRLNEINGIINVLALNAIPWGKIDIPLKYLTGGINQYEGIRLGAGFQTNPLFNKRFSLGAFAGFGLRDKAWKYGGNISFTLHERTATQLHIAYSQNKEEPGNTDYFTKNGSLLSNQWGRKFMATRMDSVEQYKIDFSTKINPSLQTNIWFKNEQRSPSGYDYLFGNINTAQTIRQFTNTEIGLAFRYAKGEGFLRLGRAKVQNKPTTTQLLVQVTQSIKEVFDGQLSYTKTALQWNHIFNSRWLGQTIVQFEAGKIWGNTPYAYLFNTKASFQDKINSIYIPNTFQTAGLYEFAASEMAAVFIQHNFSSLLFKPKNVSFRPEFLLVQGISYGKLENAAAQKNIAIQSPDKGLYESGIMIKNLYRKKIANLIYAGLGGGVFYRYGYYALDDKARNRAFKVALDFSF
jgi:Family of unknown function (DUF5686)/CarboxypepD_reg-like domain